MIPEGADPYVIKKVEIFQVLSIIRMKEIFTKGRTAFVMLLPHRIFVLEGYFCRRVHMAACK